jgi:addiction module RelB/DinJ family antitoxin
VGQINIRVDDSLKKEADGILEELGLNMTTAFTVFIKQVVRQRGLPFPVALEQRRTGERGNARTIGHSSSYGCLSKYADPSLITREKGVWKQAVIEKYANR